VRTLLDLATVLSAHELERAVDEAQVRRLADRQELIRALRRRPGRAGTAVLSALLRRENGPGLTRSQAEDRLLGLLGAGRLPPPQVNVRVHGYEVDLLWPTERLVVEVDGYAFHSTRAAFERDRRRDAELQARGLRVIRVTWRQIVEEPHALLVRIAQALTATSNAD
jgi:very-short-patch-repair endonuclease